MLEAHFLGEVLLVHHERQCHGGIEDLELVSEHLDLAALQRRVHGSLGAAAHDALHAQHELVAHAVGDGEGVRAIGIADDLDKALAVAQVDEDDAAVVAPAMRPAEEGDGLAEKPGIGEAAIFGAHGYGHWIPVDTGMTPLSGFLDPYGALARTGKRFR